MTKLFLNQKFILTLIIINTITLFIEGYYDLIDPIYIEIAQFIDHKITILFLIEAIIKIRHYGWKKYWSSSWNKLDFLIVLMSIPHLLASIPGFEMLDMHILSVFRVLRALRLLRMIRFVPNVDKLIEGVIRALKSTVIIIFIFFVALIIVTIFSNYLFHESVPEHFGDPMASMYSVFKIFTIEGWFEVPDEVATNYTGWSHFFVRFYFICVLFIGGIIGLSLFNSIFVDAMLSDNNKYLEEQVDGLTKELDEIKSMIGNIDKNLNNKV